jgi:serine/threonine-protein kinase
VYLARPEGCPPTRPPDYVVKCLKPTYEDDPLAVSLLHREAYVGRQVNHPHLISVLAARIDQRPRYLVMPRLEGPTLSSVLHAAGQLVTPRALWFVRQVAQGLEALHQSGWIHGDIKPKNMVVSPHGHVTLIDLGFARRFGEARLTSSSALMGTMQYAAPETLVASRSQDVRSDIYSLGVTMYQMLTGHLPYAGGDAAQLASAHLQERPYKPRRFVPQMPRSVSQFVCQMLAKEPLRRPQTSGELIRQLIELEIETLSMQVGA